MTPLPQIISSGIAEFWETRIDDCETLNDLFAVGDMWNTEIAHEVIDPRLTSFATNVHNAALEESFDYFENLIGALGSKLVLSGRVSLEDLDIIKQESRAKLSALKKENV